MDIFEQASRLKILYNNPRGGTLSVNDLWDLPLTSAVPSRVNLDSLAMDLHRQLLANDGVASFVDDTKEKDPLIQLAFDVVKRVIEVRKAERDLAKTEKAKADQKKMLLEALADSEHGELRKKTPEEIRAMIAAL